MGTRLGQIVREICIWLKILAIDVGGGEGEERGDQVYG